MLWVHVVGYSISTGLKLVWIDRLPTQEKEVVIKGDMTSLIRVAHYFFGWLVYI